MTISLSPDLETKLRREAERHGVDASTYASQLIVNGLSKSEPPAHPNQATLDLLAQWEREDATSDPKELARREREGEELLQNIARNRLEMEGPQARKLWPPQS